MSPVAFLAREKRLFGVHVSKKSRFCHAAAVVTEASSSMILSLTSTASTTRQTRVCDHDWRRADRHPGSFFGPSREP
jgi:hypothetical protein